MLANICLLTVQANTPPVVVSKNKAAYRIDKKSRKKRSSKILDTINVAGGVGSPCHYGGVSKEKSLSSPSHPLSSCPAIPTHNQHIANNTQHFSNHQHSSMLYHNAACIQSSQYCYDRTSVTLYQSGPGDMQDVRPPSSSNSASHQIGGKSYDLLMSCDHHSAIILTTTPCYMTCIYCVVPIFIN
jgi:hypothetical protein